MNTRLHIAEHFSLPVDAVTESFAILAIKRAGKSYTARRLTEQFYKSGQQVVIVDPKGDWWGIRSSLDGKSAGLPIIILGGEHGDVSLETGSGEVVAKLVVEEQISALLDLGLFRKKEVSRFMADFLETLYRLKAREQYRTPMMLMVDEADAIAPQRPYEGEERMLGAAEDIVRRGGQRGIGCTLVSQRAAVLNKNVLTQCGILVALRTMGSQDIDALWEWIKKHGNPDQAKVLLDSLASLPQGDAWFWSPAWPPGSSIFQRVHILPIETFDSGATPKPGEKRIQPRNLADVDLEALRRQMASTIERSKAEDPKELRRQIIGLQVELRKKSSPSVPGAASTVDPQVLKRAEERGRHAGEKLVEAMHRSMLGVYRTLLADFDRVASVLDRGRRELRAVLEEPAPSVLKEVTPLSPSVLSRQAAAKHSFLIGQPSQPMSKAERKILTAIARYPAGRSKRQTAILAVYAKGGGGFNNALSSLRTKGWIDGYDPIKITDAGIAALGGYELLPVGKELLEHWRRQLGKAEREILDVLVNAHPELLTKEQIAEKTPTGYAPDGGGFNNALSRLRTLELIEGRGELKASEELFS